MPHPHLCGWAGDSGANVRGSDLSSSHAVLGKCSSCDIMQIYPRGNYYYKEQGYRLYSHLSLTREWPSIVARGRITPLKFEQYSGLTQ